ncbi:MAG TPA: mechanosensitive ion channel family protein [Casimicrobiaceae bacterium]|nr:mechanosensitive ion channel family protein [Casimicrobiaceae bacterium]
MQLDQLVNDALMFAAGALLLVLIAQFFGTPRRQGLLPMLVVVAAGVGGLWLLDHYSISIKSGLLATILRETALALVAFGTFQIVVRFVFQTLLARRGIPRILDEFVIALSLVGYAIFRLNAVGVNLAGLITTSAVLTGALAFSAQATLGNLWGGIALQLEKTCRVGDWVRIDDLTGQVVSIRWRHMAIATPQHETIVIPNAMLMNNKVTVVARHGEERTGWIRAVPFQVGFSHSPASVVDVVARALAQADMEFVAKDPAPRVVCTDFKDSGIEYAVRYDLTDVAHFWRGDSIIRLHVYAALKRAGFDMPFPHRVVEMRSDARSEAAALEIEHREAALATMDLFASLTAVERAALARELTTSLYAGGDTVCRAGEPADSLYLLARGRVDIVGTDAGGQPHRFATLDAPAYFGEMGLLLGQPRAATVVAIGEALCYRLDKRGFDGIIRARPELAELLAKVLAQRLAANDATLHALDAEARARHGIGRAKDLMNRIQQFFGLAG